MDDIKAALHNLLLKVLKNLGSSKVWMTLLGMGLSAYMGWQYGGTEGIAIAVAGALGLPLTYTVVKGYQNTHGANLPAPQTVPGTQVIVAPAQIPAGPVPAGIPAAAVSAAEIPPVNLVKLALETNLALVGPDQGAFAYLRGVMGEQLRAFIQQCADNNLTTPAAIQALANQFFGVLLTEQQCSNIQSTVGLPAVMTEMHDRDILDSFETAYNAGTLGPAMMDALRNAARYYAALDIVNAYSKAVMYAPNEAERSLALQKFGIPKAQADQTQTVGASVYYKAANGQYTMFNGAALIGLASDTMKPR